MRRILIAALLVPAVAFAGPRKKPKKPKKKAAPVATEPAEKSDDTDADKPDAATTPLLGKSDSTGSGAGSGTATTTVPTTTKGSATTSTSATTKGTSGGGGSSTGATAGTMGVSTSGTTSAGTSGAATGNSSGGANGGNSSTGASGGPTSGAADDNDKPAPEAKDVDVDSLRQEYLSLRDELFKSRARANAVASALYSTRVVIKFNWASARYYGVSKASIRLDGATVYEDATGAIGGDDGVRFDGYIAPGKHLITFHVEATGKDDDSFTSVTESQVVIKAVPNKDLVVNAKGHDSGDIAYAWKRSERGSYGLGIDVGVKTIANGAAKK